MTKERLAATRVLAARWLQEPESSPVHAIGEMLSELVAAIPARCGDVLAGDEGEQYVCALDPAHTISESDHTDALGLAQWPVSSST